MEPLPRCRGGPTGLPCCESLRMCVLRPLPRRVGRPSHVGGSGRPRRPSSNVRRLGTRVDTFGACSGFTRVAARTLAWPTDRGPLSLELRRLGYPRRLPGSYQGVPTPPWAGLAPAALTHLSRHTHKPRHILAPASFGKQNLRALARRKKMCLPSRLLIHGMC